MTTTSVHGHAKTLAVAFLAGALGLASATPAPAAATWSVEFKFKVSGQTKQRLDPQDRQFLAALERDLDRQVRSGSTTRSQLVNSFQSELNRYQSSRGTETGSGLVAAGGTSQAKWELELTIKVGGNTGRQTAEERAFVRSLEKKLTRKLQSGAISEQQVRSEIEAALHDFGEKLQAGGRQPTWADEKVGVTAMLVFTVHF
jgi:hypothetical protein